VNRFFTKFGTNVPLVDVINPDKLCVNLFKGFDFTGVKVSIFPIGNWRRRYNVKLKQVAQLMLMVRPMDRVTT